MADTVQQQIDSANNAKKVKGATKSAVKSINDRLAALHASLSGFDQTIGNRTDDASNAQEMADNYRAEANRLAKTLPKDAQHNLNIANKYQAQADAARADVQKAQTAKQTAVQELNTIVPASETTAEDRAFHGGSAPTPAAPGTPGAAPTAPAIPQDSRGFQSYLNTLGAGLTVDGIIGPKTLAAAKKYNVAVPSPTNPAPTPVQSAPGQSPSPSTSTNAPTSLAAAPDLASITAQMKSQYGYLGAVLDNPDVGAVLTNAVKNGTPAGDPSITAALMSTPTMQGLSKNQVGYDIATPGEQQALVTQAQDFINHQSQVLGVDIAPDRLAQMAKDAARNGWGASSPELSNAIAAEFHYTAGAQHGAIGTAESQIKQTAANYFVPMSDSTLASLDQQVAAGTMTSQDFTQYAIAQAKSLYAGNSPQLGTALDKGMTMDQIADPYRQDAASVLGVDPNSIDFTKPQWLKALSYTDPSTGTTGMMSRFAWQNTLRTDPQYGWDRTPGGVQAGYDVRNALANAFGVS